jgi:hypothetical protein
LGADIAAEYIETADYRWQLLAANLTGLIEFTTEGRQLRANITAKLLVTAEEDRQLLCANITTPPFEAATRIQLLNGCIACRLRMCALVIRVRRPSRALRRRQD